MNSAELEEQLSQAYDEFADAVFKHAYFRTHDREVAKDLTQQTFVNTWQYLATGSTIENMKAFLFTTANRQIIDYVRKQKKRYTASLDQLLEDGGIEPVASESTEDRTKEHFTEQRIHSLIAQLKEPYKTAVVLRYINQLTPPEVAEATRVSVSNASARISRGIKMLRALLT